MLGGPQGHISACGPLCWGRGQMVVFRVEVVLLREQIEAPQARSQQWSS